ncbi:MAG: ATP-binding protein [Myxococcota bacterium]
MSFHKKIFFIILAVHLIVGTVSVFLVNRIIRESLSIGLNPNIKADIENIYNASKEEVATRKRLYNYICLDVLDAIKSVDINNLTNIRQIILRNISTYTDLESVEINGERVQLITSPESEKNTYYVSAQSFNGNSFNCRFVVPQIVLSNQKSLMNVISIHDSISNMRKDLITFYLRVYIFLFGISFLTVMVLGYVFIGTFLSPVNEIKAGIRRIKNNIFDRPIVVNSRDEMGELAQEINRLSVELRLAKERESYLERISSYQEVARRIAHEIKNPLTPIRLAFQEIEARYKGDDENYRKLLTHSREIVDEEIDALNRIIDQFREFAKMPVAEIKPARIDEFITEVMKANNYFADRIKIELRLKSEDAMVSIDKLLLKKVFENLIQNSIEAGANTIVISSQKTEDLCILRFEDNGSGIDEKIQDVIFEPYFTTKENGTGLGLSLTKKAILEHKGDIYLDREYKGGTAFVIELPIDSSTDI